MLQLMMDTILAGVKWQTRLVRLDDVVVFVGTLEEQLQRLTMALEAIREAGLSLNEEMCRSGHHEHKYLGQELNAAQVSPTQEKSAFRRNQQ